MYTPYLIANYATGIEKRLQPWLIPDDAQEELLDGYVYRGTMSKRDGYSYLATGLRNGQPYRESRIIHTLTTVPALQVPNGIILTFTLAGTSQIPRGSVIVNGSNPLVVGTDNGLGVISGIGITSGTVNYITGAISVTFTVAPAIASTVTFTYSFMPGNPVMMESSFYTATNARELIVADTKYVNKYDTTNNILIDISPATAYTGTSHNFFSWVNYPDANDVNRLLFVNNKDVIQSYDGTAVTDYVYTSTEFTTITSLLMVEFKDRLILLRTNEDGTIYPRRIRISGFGGNCDIFDNTVPGAGFIDIPDNTWIFGAAFSRDDLIIFTEGSTWSLRYTGNDTTPFVLVKLDQSRGSQAPFSAITYLNRTSAASPRGLIITDGYQVERQDMSIPQFSFNEIDAENFDLCFAGSVDEDRDHYLIYPPPNQTVGSEKSLRILTTNYDEDNYSTYRLPLSCMGTYIESFDVTWDDLLIYKNWNKFSADYENWNSFVFSKGSPFSVGGGHKGEIWKLSEEQSVDNPVNIRNITIIDANTIEVTTDWNNYSQNDNDATFGYGFEPNMGNDYIFLTAVEGMLEVNSKQYPILTITNNNVFRLTVEEGTANLSAYTSGGNASRVIPFTALMKQFNPFVNSDKKVRCGWIYMYVDTTGTSLTRNIAIDAVSKSNPCIITTQVNHNLNTGDQVYLFGLGGMVELNGVTAPITFLTDNTFSLDGIDSTTFTTYTSGGYASTSVPATLSIDVFVDDRNDESQLNAYGLDPYQGNCSNMTFVDGSKKWYKVYINQTGKFIQFQFRNRQAGAVINIQAFMPGFAPVGRLI